MTPPQLVALEGVRALVEPDENEILEAALREHAKISEIERLRQRQVIEFDSGPVAFALQADLHFGDPGTDVGRIFSETELLLDTPGVYFATVGDLVNNMIVGRLVKVLMHNRMTIRDEWVLVRRWLRLVGSRLLLAVGGNHDYWTEAMAGIPYLREAIAEITPDVIFDDDDARVTLKIGDRTWDMRLRHKWRGSSIYNPTHGIERGWLFSKDFVLGVGAHTHAGSVARTFSAGGEQGLAVQLGSYKTFDKYARMQGFNRPPRSAAALVVFDPETGAMAGYDSVELGCKVMRAFYGQ